MYEGGYAGKILRIDLSKQSAREEALPEELVKNYLGGAGFAIKCLYDEVKPDTNPLDKANRLIFAVGPLTATGASCSSRKDLDEILDEYYSERGWDKNGAPTAAKLKELGLK